MQRRTFFRSLLGAPAAAIAAPAKPEPVIARGAYPTCECGYAYVRHVLDPFRPKGSSRPVEEYIECLNPNCRHFRKALAMPTVAMESADPELVRTIAAQERDARRDWERMQAEKEEANRRAWLSNKRIEQTATQLGSSAREWQERLAAETFKAFK
jgi:hypothetical protein